ncbi:hypothetical protein ILYODFUR_003591 [Ilyodon furcidens]|uniref:Uncharacterized protein n=1 Tax=Ilyodon furcidens TaxID=33524 RepID=A0ABV0U2F1_9TELE
MFLACLRNPPQATSCTHRETHRVKTKVCVVYPFPEKKLNNYFLSRQQDVSSQLLKLGPEMASHSQCGKAVTSNEYVQSCIVTGRCRPLPLTISNSSMFHDNLSSKAQHDNVSESDLLT